MLGTYASALIVVVAAGATGQAILAACGHRGWSWLAPAVGLAALLAVAWWSVRLPGEGTAAMLVLAAATIAGLLASAGRADGLREALRSGWPVAALAMLAASLPFIVEARFGILGTGLNPDMSQHLFAADRLAESGSERLIAEGYPLGPHALVVALSALGPSLIQAFGGLTLATAVITALTPLAVLERLPPWRRLVAALLVGFAYMTAAYLVQGAFKETIQALLLLAFAIGLGEMARGRLAGRGPARAIPLAVLAIGSVYAYSFPGLIWLLGAAAAWAALELVLAVRGGLWERGRRMVRGAIRPAVAAGLVLLAGIAPEAGRIADFASFETFDPEGAGLGNLFDRISPLEALGIWPSGDFRLDAGAGFAPAIVFWAGSLIGLLALGLGLWWWLRRGDRAVPAALAASTALIAFAAIAGTPYQEAKAIALAAPLAMLISIGALAEVAPTRAKVVQILRRRGIARLFPRSARTARIRLGLAALAVSFAVGAAACSLIALVNGPVGPSGWSADLLERKGDFRGATLVLADPEFLEEHGRDFIVWELRGGHVCVEPHEGPSGAGPPPGIHQVVVTGDAPEAPFEGTDAGADLGELGMTLWKIPDLASGDSGCPFIADGARADPGGDR